MVLPDPVTAVYGLVRFLVLPFGWALVTVFLAIGLWPVLYPLIGYAHYKFTFGTLAHSYWTFLASDYERRGALRITWYGVNPPARESAIVFSNHQWFCDWLSVFTLAVRKGRVGVLKFFAKESIKLIPGFGWGVWASGGVFLKRNWERDSASIERTFRAIRSQRLPVWMVSWPEGTRPTPEKIKASHVYAKKHNLPLLDHVCLPRTRGFVATVQGLEGICDVVYDLTFMYTPSPPTLLELAAGTCSDKQLHVHIQRFEIKDLPRDSTELAAWLVRQYEKKDALIAHFKRTGAFPAPVLDMPWEAPAPELEFIDVDRKLAAAAKKH